MLYGEPETKQFQKSFVIVEIFQFEKNPEEKFTEISSVVLIL